MELPLLRTLPLPLLLLLLLLVPRAQPQYYPTAAARPLYYARESPPPRHRRLEYAPYGSYIAPAAPPPHYQPQQQTPNFQLLNYRPSYQPLVPYQQQQQQPPIYPQPSSPAQYQQRVAAPHAELAKYRYEGNYLQRLPVTAPAPSPPPLPPPAPYQPQAQTQRRVEEQLYNVPPALFTSNVLHVLPRSARAEQQQAVERPRRYTQDQDALAAESTTRHFHDIFMRIGEPQASSSHGYVLKQPGQEARRFETQRGANRYKGEVIWTDRQGGHGEHRWDLAQGKL